MWDSGVRLGREVVWTLMPPQGLRETLNNRTNADCKEGNQYSGSLLLPLPFDLGQARKPGLWFLYMEKGKTKISGYNFPFVYNILCTFQ